MASTLSRVILCERTKFRITSQSLSSEWGSLSIWNATVVSSMSCPLKLIAAITTESLRMSTPMK